MDGNPPSWHSFRLRFKTARTFPVCPEVEEFLVSEDDEEVVWITSVGGGPVGETEWLTLRGARYPSHEAAIAAGERWRDAIERAFAGLHVPADFGERKAFSSWMSPKLLEELSDGVRGRVMNDVHGLIAYPPGEPVYFVSGTASGYAPRPLGALRHAVIAPSNRRIHDQQRLAYNLYSHAMLSKSADAKFVLLMMAVEALMTPFDRSEQVQHVVEGLRGVVVAAGLGEAEGGALLSHIGQAKRASFRQQGERLARTLADNRYGDMHADEFFVRCYKLRGRVVHGDADRPSQDEVNRLGGELSRFVADLIAGPERSGTSQRAFDAQLARDRESCAAERRASANARIGCHESGFARLLTARRRERPSTVGCAPTRCRGRPPAARRGAR